MNRRKKQRGIGIGRAAVAAIVIAIAIAVWSEKGGVAMGTLGGIRDVGGFQNNAEIENVARFAVDEHNKQQNGAISFSRVVKAQEQVVAGTMYHLTIEAKDGSSDPKLYEAKVWVKPWENFKELREFKPLLQTSVTPADLGVKHGN